MRKISNKRSLRIENESLKCSHPAGCLNQRLGNSPWCDMHRTRMRRTGELGSAGVKQPHETCQVDGCDLPYRASGMCSLHWDQNDRKDENKRISRRRSELKRLGWTPEEYQAFNIAQNGKCAKCGQSNYERGHNVGLAADHCHETGKPRGLLCHICNVGIGMLGDGIEGLREALRYLELTSHGE